MVAVLAVLGLVMTAMLRVNVKVKSTGEESTSFSIGEVARRFDLPPNVLRHWESVGLLAPERAVAERRRYDDNDLYRVAAIMIAKEAGFSLDTIRAMVTTTDPADRAALLRRQRAELAARIAAAEASLDIIDAALTCEHGDFTRCPRFQATLSDRVAR